MGILAKGSESPFHFSFSIVTSTWKCVTVCDFAERERKYLDRVTRAFHALIQSLVMPKMTNVARGTVT